MNLIDYEALPFFEFRRPDEVKVGDKYQLYDNPIRKQMKELKESPKDAGMLFYMECTDIKKTNMPEVTFVMKTIGWSR